MTKNFLGTIGYIIKGIKYEKTNTTDYFHTRYYYRYGTNLIKTA